MEDAAAGRGRAVIQAAMVATVAMEDAPATDIVQVTVVGVGAGSALGSDSDSTTHLYPPITQRFGARTAHPTTTLMITIINGKEPPTNMKP
jgi:hypothetical protein